MERELRVSRAPSCHRALPRATFSLGGAQAWGTRNTARQARACQRHRFSGDMPPWGMSWEHPAGPFSQYRAARGSAPTPCTQTGPSWGPRCGAWNFGKVT